MRVHARLSLHVSHLLVTGNSDTRSRVRSLFYPSKRSRSERLHDLKSTAARHIQSRPLAVACTTGLIGFRARVRSTRHEHEARRARVSRFFDAGAPKPTWVPPNDACYTVCISGHSGDLTKGDSPSQTLSEGEVGKLGTHDMSLHKVWNICLGSEGGRGKGNEGLSFLMSLLSMVVELRYHSAKLKVVLG